jgi:hypothetical protein
MSTFALLAFALVAATLGAMVFFVGAIAPTVFRVLPQAEGGRFLRALFRNYYVAFAASSLLATGAAAAAGRGWEAVLLALVAAGFIGVRQGLMPRINALRDRMLAGDTAAGSAFNALHRASVWVNTAQIAALLLVAVLLAR